MKRYLVCSVGEVHADDIESSFSACQDLFSTIQAGYGTFAEDVDLLCRIGLRA